MPAGLPGGTTSWRWLVANTCGSPSVPPASTTVCMVASSAVASTSAGAPWVTCSARVALESNDSFTFTPGWSASKSLASVVNVSVSDAAPSTVRVPVSFSVPEAELLSPEPQPARASVATRDRARATVRFFMAAPRRRWWT